MPESIDPANGQTIARYEPHSLEAAREIVRSTHASATAWAKVPVAERATLSDKTADVLADRKEELARLITHEMGKPITQSRAEIDKCAWVCRYYAENGPAFLADEPLESDGPRAFTAFQPIGVVLAVMPWNFPFWQVFRFAAPGLTAGNGAVLKHASNVTGCSLAIESVFRDAGYPEDLFRSLVLSSRDIGGLIADPHIEAATLTGSETAGRAVAEAAGKAIKKTVLELGGSDPYLILEDADLDLAAEKCAASRLINSGQSCIAAKRFIVERSVHAAFTEKLVRRMESRRMGNPMETDTGLGPQARKDLRDELHDQVERSIRAGAVLLTGGQLPEGPGSFYPATVLDQVRPGMPAADEELFGPVAAVLVAEDADAAVRMANASRFGLGGAVFSRDLDKAEKTARRMETGTVAVNDLVKSDPRMPFGGIKRSGYGRELHRFGIREFVNIKTVVIDEGDRRA